MDGENAIGRESTLARQNRAPGGLVRHPSDPRTRAGLVDPLRDGGAAAGRRLRARLDHLVPSRRIPRAPSDSALRPPSPRPAPGGSTPPACAATAELCRTRRIAGLGSVLEGHRRPLWTFPRLAWERELLPGAQVVLAPTADFAGSLTVGDSAHRIDGWRGAVAHIYGHGNAKRWGWIHADLGGGDVLEAVTAVSHKPGLRRLTPLAFVRFRIDGKDWPASLCRHCGCGQHSACGTGSWKGASAAARCSSASTSPPDRCVSLGYTDPDGGTAVCTNTEQADVHVEIDDRRWSVLGTDMPKSACAASRRPPSTKGSRHEFPARPAAADGLAECSSSGTCRRPARRRRGRRPRRLLRRIVRPLQQRARARRAVAAIPCPQRPRLHVEQRRFRGQHGKRRAGRCTRRPGPSSRRIRSSSSSADGSDLV